MTRDNAGDLESPATTVFSETSESTESSEPEVATLNQSDAPRGFFNRMTSKVAKVVSPPTSGGRKPPSRSSSLGSEAENMFSKPNQPMPREAQGKQRIVPELDQLMVYTAGVKYRGFSKLIEYKPEEMFSVSEKVANKLLKVTPMDFIQHNRDHLSRVYPNGTRLTSKNYLPHHFWAMGAQLVAINWQTCGESCLVMDRVETRDLTEANHHQTWDSLSTQPCLPVTVIADTY